MMRSQIHGGDHQDHDGQEHDDVRYRKVRSSRAAYGDACAKRRLESLRSARLFRIRWAA